MNTLIYNKASSRLKHIYSSGCPTKYIINSSYRNLHRIKNNKCTGRGGGNFLNYSYLLRKFPEYNKLKCLSSSSLNAVILSQYYGSSNDANTKYLNHNNSEDKPLLSNYNFCSNTNLNNIYNQQINRYIHLCSINFEQASSKVEVTVQKIKDKQKEELIKKELSHTASINLESGKPSSSSKVSTATPATTAIQKKPLKTRIWEECVHYYNGFRLLFLDIKISMKLVWRVLTGKKLTRRESRLLVRTTSDLFRLVPFSIFIIVPFLEFTLPLFIKIFPGMLPSTFQTAKDREDRLKSSLQVKLEVAKFLQKTLDEMAVQHVEHKSEEAKEFSEFFRKIKNPSEVVSNEDIIKFSKQFEDELTLDSLSRGQLTALCRILELNTIGTNNFLRFQLRVKLRSLAADDKVIQREGVDSLNMIELQQACKARGMRAYGLSEEKLRKQLEEWIDLSITEKVPPVLLLLSRALMVPDETSTTDKLKTTISLLPDAVGTQTKAAIGEREGKIDNKTKIEVIKEEERKIKEEREEEKENEKEKIKEDIRDKAEILVDKAPSFKEQPTFVGSQVVKEPEVISSRDVEVLEEALETLSKDKKTLLVEKETIKDLKEEIEEYKEDVDELHEITKNDKKEVRETRAAKILYKKVNSMINNLDKVLTDLEKKEKKLREDIKAATESEKAIDSEKKDQLVRIDDLVLVIKQLRTVSDESKLSTIEKVLSKIDDDQDGQLKVDDVLRVIETIGRDNVKLSEKQVEELVELLDKEELIEAEEKIEKALAKSLKDSTSKKENLQDTATILTDSATDLSISDKINRDDAQLKEQNLENVIKSAAINQEAADKHIEKILPKKTSEIPSTTIPPTIPTPKSSVNPKDKML